MGTKQSDTEVEGETIVEQDALTTKHPDVEFHPMLKQTIEMWCKSGIRDTYDNKCFKRDVLSRISEITSIMSQIAEESNGGNSDKCRINDGVYRLDWESVYEVGASIMDQYSATVDELLADLDKLYRKQYLWQDSAVLLDSFKGATIIGRLEKWTKLKEAQLEYKQNELVRSADEIKRALKRLSTENVSDS
ncbi:Hypothetical protein J6897_04745 [Nakaseomyces glabratus]|nr:hypothetical protein J6895_04746 [Nakaseomyces glabratus]